MIQQQDYGSNDEYFEAVLENRKRHSKALMDSIDNVIEWLTEYSKAYYLHQLKRISFFQTVSITCAKLRTTKQALSLDAKAVF